MKHWKQGFIGLLVIFVLAFAFIACDDGNGKNDPICECNPKEHYLPCTCGGTDCTCVVIPRGYIAEQDTNVPIPIYQTVGVNDTQAVSATASIIAEWEILDRGDRLPLKGKIKQVRIIQKAVNQTNYYDYEVVENKIIIKIQHNTPEGYFADAFVHFANNVLPGLELD